MKISTSRVVSIQGEYRPPSDKSLTHRSYMFAAISDGMCKVHRPLRGADCEATLRCLEQLGLVVEWLDEETVMLHPASHWRQPHESLDCGNSGTTMRLLAGLIASRPIKCTLIGDESLSRRPMGRIAEPLRLMGAEVLGATPPLAILGGDLRGIDYRSQIASAQIKSCTLLAGLGARGLTTVREPSLSRDHTERMLAAMGVDVQRETSEDGHEVSVHGGQSPHAFEMTIPGDISSAAFLMVAAAALPNSELGILDLSVNPTRTGILDVLSQCGMPAKVGEERLELGEPVADVSVRAPKRLKPFTIGGSLVPRLIDEIPVLAVLATQCDGVSVIRDARELRVKECDRIEAIACGLRAMGARVDTYEDGMNVFGPTPLIGAEIDCLIDHRIAMSFAIAGLMADGTTSVEGAESIETSYPEFLSDLTRLCIV